MRKKAAAEHWRDQRNKYREKQVRKSIARACAREVTRLSKLQDSATMVSDELLELMDNIDQ